VRTSIVIAALLLGSLAAAPARSQALPPRQCRNLAATAVAFGTYDVFSAVDLTSTGTISYSCGNRTAPNITISASSNGAYRPRQLRSGTNTLNYELYADPAMTVVWGTGADAQTVANGTNLTLTVYGKIFQQQDVAVGSYSDTITVTINF
jgi:spore coat protein U-like protein